MKEGLVTADLVTAFGRYLQREEREQSTIEKYQRDVRSFVGWLGNGAVTKEIGRAHV